MKITPEMKKMVKEIHPICKICRRENCNKHSRHFSMRWCSLMTPKVISEEEFKKRFGKRNEITGKIDYDEIAIKNFWKQEAEKVPVKYRTRKVKKVENVNYDFKVGDDVIYNGKRIKVKGQICKVVKLVPGTVTLKSKSGEIFICSPNSVEKTTA